MIIVDVTNFIINMLPTLDESNIKKVELKSSASSEDNKEAWYTSKINAILKIIAPHAIIVIINCLLFTNKGQMKYYYY